MRVNGRMCLVSPVSKYHWSVREAKALCPKCVRLITLYSGPHASVQDAITPIGDDCTCGIYALNSPEAVCEYFGGGKGIDILGQVIMYGKVIVGERGCRAEKAKVSMLMLPTFRRIEPTDIEELAREYGVDLILAQGDLRKWLEHHRNLDARKIRESRFGKVRKHRYFSRQFTPINSDGYDEQLDREERHYYSMDNL